MKLDLRPKKEQLVDDFRQWAIDNDVEFTEHANGHFQVYVYGNKLMDVWATTQKCKLITGDTHVGIPFIKKSIIGHMEAASI